VCRWLLVFQTAHAAPAGSQVSPAHTSPDLRDPVDVLAGYQEELADRPRDPRLAIRPVLVALVERVGVGLRRPLDDEHEARYRTLTLDPLDTRRTREIAA